MKRTEAVAVWKILDLSPRRELARDRTKYKIFKINEFKFCK